jgi:hypothetical protein
LAVVTAVFFVQTYGKALREGGNDFTTYLRATDAFWRGESPYRIDVPFPFVYPLTLCVLVWPLVLVPYRLAVGAWYVVSVAAVGLMFGSLAAGGWRVAAAALTLLPSLDIVQNNLVNGQINFLILALCAVFWKLWVTNRRTAAGIALGCAVAVKMTPALLLVMLTLRRDARTMAVALATAVVLGVCLPWLVQGGLIADWYHDYATGFVASRLADPVVGDRLTFSVAGVLARWRGASSAYDAPLAAAVVLGVVAWLDVRRRRHAGEESPATLALYLATIPLLTPISETHHLAFLLPAMFLLMVEVLAGRLPSWIAIAVAVVVALVRFVPEVAFVAVLATVGSIALAPARRI